MTETSICSSSDYNQDEEERIVLHVYDDESKEFTSLTTYHGMIRIYTSETWPSRIFWGVVVVTCVTLFMIQGGVLLEFYNSHPTATKIDEYELLQSYAPSISICPYGFKTNEELFFLITEYDTNIDVPFNIWQNSSRSLLVQNSYKCNDVINSITIEDDQVLDFCSKSRSQITDFGLCFTFEHWKDYETSSITVKLKNEFQKTYTAHIHEESFEVSRLTTRAWLKPGKHAKLSFSIEEIVSIKFLVKHTSCDCPVQCYSRNFKMQPVYLLKSNKNESTITFHINSRLLKSHQQYKRFKQIDLMSYIGGVMGLFLGMSCITLLEVFIYLFKTIFGTLNNNRHKEFVERLLSDDDGSVHGSHEEIIITQKIDKPKVTFETPVEVPRTPEPVSQISQAPRRFSLMPAMNNQLGVKVQFHRPNHTLKRNSIYLGNCDF
ncbi:Protein CBR-TAG-324 [Caenorhabditis briggsae]|uniref:Protein CBR-TAG-324 n=1 Tax=Caenorhabditis briggsae TaxID=6238 RepID=A8X4G8_CAEBR|nr:Protein CBR-TAG-324 [Caenorhabditis briggsae]CAP27528.2 Protein CBR-TAG-324 [Caenorhabditis briggsae]